MTTDAPKPPGSAESLNEQPESKPSRAAPILPFAWKPGQSGNPTGRPKGTRNKLAEAFLDDLMADWKDNGVQAIKDAREESPVDYVKIVAATLPKEFVIDRPADGLSDDQLAAFLDLVRSALAEGRGLSLGGGTVIEAVADEVVPLQAIPEAAGVPHERPDAPGAPADGGQPAGQDDRRLDGSGDARDRALSG